MSNIQKAIDEKIKQLHQAAIIPGWRYRIGAGEGAQAPDFDDSGWEWVRLSQSWSSLDGEAWFRASVTPPAEVEGIDLTGCRLEMDMFLAIGASVYVNGKEMYTEPSWTDTRAVPLLLQESYTPGQTLSLVVRCKQGDGFGLFIAAALNFSRLSEAVFELELVKSQFAFTGYLAGANPEKLALCERAAAALDLEALAANRWGDWQTSVNEARVILSPFEAEAKTYHCTLLAHSHIDMNWLWPMKETVEVCRRDFSTMDRLMERYPEYHFSQSQAATYRFMEQEYPEIFERMRARIAEGRWEITANTWVEGDLNMAAGETLVRQILHARRYIDSRFGVRPLVCWEPDTFGHPITYPQILQKSGIPYYYFCRAGKRHPLFWWEGLDGSRVMGMQDPLGYGGNNNPSQIVGCVVDFNQRYGIHEALYVYGAGDHGGGGTARDIEAARLIDAAPLMPRALPGTATRFFQEVEGQAPDLPVVKAELNTVFEGCYTSHGDIKRMNRQGENNLLSAETVVAARAALAGGDIPQGELAEAWRTLCFHQFHDILCGCAIGVTYREARERLEQVFRTSEGLSSQALDALASTLDTTSGGEGARVVVFNPLAWERTDVVRVPLQRLGGAIPAALVDESGRAAPVQVCGDELVFVAEDLPAMGTRVYHAQAELRPAQDAGETGGVQTVEGKTALENGLLRLHIHPASGAVEQLIDLQNGRELAAPPGGWGPEAKVNAGMLNRLQILWEQPHPMSAWNIGDITRVDNLLSGAEVKVIETGAVRGVIEVRRAFLHSSLVQRVVLYRGLRRIDFETEVDWHERGSAHQDSPMLRATFTPYFGHTQAAFEVAFAGLQRPADGREVPALRWADLSQVEGASDGAYGLSLLNDCKYGHQAQGNTLGLTLVRASYEPDNNPDEGLHRFTYSLYPHEGDWKQAGTIRRAAELNQPVLVTVTGAHPGALRAGGHGLRSSVDSVVISALKPAEDQPQKGRALVARVYEAHGQEAQAALLPAWPIVRAEEVNPIEEGLGELAVEGGAIHLVLKPHEIKTVKLYLE